MTNVLWQPNVLLFKSLISYRGRDDVLDMSFQRSLTVMATLRF